MRIFLMRLAALFCGILLLAVSAVLSPVLAGGENEAQVAVQNGAGQKAVLILSGSQYGIPVTETMAAHTIAALRERGVSFKDIYVEMLDLVRNDNPS